MNLSAFLNALKSEAKRSPKKAAVLGLLLIVAGYFWGPLVLKWFSGSDEAAPEAAVETIALASTAPAAAAPSPAPAPAGLGPLADWRILSRQFEVERRARAARLAVKGALFGPISSGEPPLDSKDEAPQDEEGMAAATTTPTELGLTLEGTLLLPDGAVAVIDGCRYRVGDFVSASTAQGRAESEFKLIEVRRGAAVLLRGADRHELTVAASSLAAGERVERTNGR
jgi:hypothetical protein